MMKINAGDIQFELQARTDLAVSANGTTINATIFSAFVAKDQSGASMQMELSRDKDSELWKKLHVNDEKLVHVYVIYVKDRIFLRDFIFFKYLIILVPLSLHK